MNDDDEKIGGIEWLTWWLRGVAEALATQDNEITADPIFVVQRRVRIVGMDPDISDHPIIWLNWETDEAVTLESDPAIFSELEARALKILEGNYDSDPVLDSGWDRTGYQDQWEFVQPFLTRAAAEEFLAREAHNLGKSARIYVDSGRRNAEWKRLRILLGSEALAHLQALLELLAVIHGDGGHYVDDHGIGKAVEDAITKIHDDREELSALRVQKAQSK